MVVVVEVNAYIAVTVVVAEAIGAKINPLQWSQTYFLSCEWQIYLYCGNNSFHMHVEYADLVFENNYSAFHGTFYLLFKFQSKDKLFVSKDDCVFWKAKEDLFSALQVIVVLQNF